jgi:hypothetical protein
MRGSGPLFTERLEVAFSEPKKIREHRRGPGFFEAPVPVVVY